MLVELTADRAGVTWIQREGEVVDLPSSEARRLIELGSAKLPENNQAEPHSEPADTVSNYKQRNRRR